MPDAPLLTEDEIGAALAALPAWRREGDTIVRGVKLVDFGASMSLVNAVAEAAEAADHHPDILIRWNRVTFTLTTHAAKGLTRRDLSLAAEIDRLAGEVQAQSPKG